MSAYITLSMRHRQTSSNVKELSLAVNEHDRLAMEIVRTAQHLRIRAMQMDASKPPHKANLRNTIMVGNKFSRFWNHQTKIRPHPVVMNYSFARYSMISCRYSSNRDEKSWRQSPTGWKLRLSIKKCSAAVRNHDINQSNLVTMGSSRSCRKTHMTIMKCKSYANQEVSFKRFKLQQTRFCKAPALANNWRPTHRLASEA